MVPEGASVQEWHADSLANMLMRAIARFQAVMIPCSMNSGYLVRLQRSCRQATMPVATESPSRSVVPYSDVTDVVDRRIKTFFAQDSTSRPRTFRRLSHTRTHAQACWRLFTNFKLQNPKIQAMSEQYHVDKFTVIEKRCPFNVDGTKVLKARLMIGIRWVGYGPSDDTFQDLKSCLAKSEFVPQLLEYHVGGGKGLPKVWLKKHSPSKRKGKKRKNSKPIKPNAKKMKQTVQQFASRVVGDAPTPKMVSVKAEVSDSDDDMPLGGAKTSSGSKVATMPSLSPSPVIVNKKLPMPALQLPSPKSGLGLVSPSLSPVVVKKLPTPVVPPLTSPRVVKSHSKPSRGQFGTKQGSEIVKSRGDIVRSQVANFYMGQVVSAIEPEDHALRLKALTR
jgi:hypothetical protein